GTDAIRQHSYFATLGMETAIHQPFFSVSYANDVWAPTLGINLSYDPSQLTLLPLTNGGALRLGRVARTAGLSIAYPPITSPLLSSWLAGTTIGLSANFTSYGNEVYDVSGNATALPGASPYTVPLGNGESAIVGGLELPNQVNTLALTVQSNSTTRPFRPVSPVGGPLWAAGIERADQLLGSSAAYTKAWADARYFVPTFGRQVLALRAVGGTTFNDTVFDGANRVLNPSLWALGTPLTSNGDLSYGLATSAAIHDLDDIRGLPGDLSGILPVRGYTFGAPIPGTGQGAGIASSVAGGNSAAMLTAEYRIPILDISRGLGTFPVFLDRISLAPFVDIGKAWSIWNQAMPLVGTGAELRFHIELAQAIPTEIRLGYARGITLNLGTNQIILGLGAAF
ncbi:MAG: BamA/TamA family outer membrane protein, partial [Cyanobacteria bacterium REEB65]|nr:BamA/TamA family outer membrane protein [Cyanobacteria bacterium REEB65]